jgi:hypothetical protein
MSRTVLIAHCHTRQIIMITLLENLVNRQIDFIRKKCYNIKIVLNGGEDY